MLLRGHAAAIGVALSAVDPRGRADAWQDGLDLLAVTAGMKPLCLLGRGHIDPGFAAALLEIAAAAGLVLHEDAPWLPFAAPDALPDWYVAAAGARQAAQRVLYLCADRAVRDRVAALSAQGRVAAPDEAALLGYPDCCVAAHHRGALALEALMARGIARVARGEPQRMARLVIAGVEPAPADRAEWRALTALAAIAPAPYTSVNMCAACAADPASPARRMARRFRALAVAVHYPQPT